jgi:hypothetical protein
MSSAGRSSHILKKAHSNDKHQLKARLLKLQNELDQEEVASTSILVQNNNKIKEIELDEINLEQQIQQEKDRVKV